MKHYYRIGDAILQVLLLITIVYAFVSQTEKVFSIIGVAGVWYTISIGIHLVISSSSFKVVYSSYAYITACVLALLVAGYIFPTFLFLEGYALLYALPVLAACYTYNCFAEILHVRKRPISYLK